ncbi:hypothetical protein Ciccas_011519 [Cichlidogyrus casuarinus]|uniref:Gag protein n=1 Tax=Cichlidogyrus casuarinus TaxID=1844966 RepID=A0ABD2PTY9_9PLAT
MTDGIAEDQYQQLNGFLDQASNMQNRYTEAMRLIGQHYDVSPDEHHERFVNMRWRDEEGDRQNIQRMMALGEKTPKDVLVRHQILNTLPIEVARVVRSTPGATEDHEIFVSVVVAARKGVKDRPKQPLRVEDEATTSRETPSNRLIHNLRRTYEPRRGGRYIHWNSRQKKRADPEWCRKHAFGGPNAKECTPGAKCSFWEQFTEWMKEKNSKPSFENRGNFRNWRGRR